MTNGDLLNISQEFMKNIITLSYNSDLEKTQIIDELDQKLFSYTWSSPIDKDGLQLTFNKILNEPKKYKSAAFCLKYCSYYSF